jgi:hypothetical protein
MKIYFGENEYSLVFGYWHDGVRVERVFQDGQSAPLISKRHKLHAWCEKHVVPALGGYTLREGDKIAHIDIISFKAITIHHDGLDLPCFEIVFWGKDAG